MLETEVSVEMWQNIMLPDYDNPKLQPQKNMLGETVPSRYIKLPIVGVNLQESQAFCQKLSRQINAPVSLPTEAQWEYACLAGTTDPLGVWQVPYYSNVWDAQLNAQQILQVGRYRRPDNLKPNAWGLDDMFGYVGEWCLDGYTEDLGTAPVTDPQTPSSGGKQVIRGVYPFPFENFEFTSSPPFKFRFQNFSFFRNAENPENREPEGGYVGVRICINVPAEPEKDKK